jgi:quaternary ammonium compound-resistance protein SugE
MAWIWLFIAGLFECGWAIGLKYADGFTRPLPSALTVVFMAVSLFLLSLAMRTIPVGTAYAVWTGVGAACVAVLGMVLFDEPRSVARVACLFLIVAGVAGLRVFATAGKA